MENLNFDDNFEWQNLMQSLSQEELDRLQDQLSEISKPEADFQGTVPDTDYWPDQGYLWDSSLGVDPFPSSATPPSNSGIEQPASEPELRRRVASLEAALEKSNKWVNVTFDERQSNLGQGFGQIMGLYATLSALEQCDSPRHM
ncbi:hypothetical protein ACLMJK_004872 [Lecanora helva]